MDDEEFERLYVTMAVAVVSLAARFLLADQADDVSADTFELIWRIRGSFPPDRVDWPSWTIGIAKNKIREYRRSAARKRHDAHLTALDVDTSADCAFPDIAESVTEALWGRWVWKQLRPSERHLANLAFVHGMDKGVAAEQLGISVSNYTTRVSRLRRRIADLAESDAMDEPDERDCAFRPPDVRHRQPPGWDSIRC